MGFLRKKEEKTENSATIKKTIVELYADGKFEDVIGRLKQCKKLTGSEQQIIAMCYFNLEKYSEALPFFENISKLNGDTSCLFNYLTVLLKLKEIEKSTEIFNKIVETSTAEKCSEKQFTPQIYTPFVRFYYAWGMADAKQYKRAYEQLNILKKLYAETVVTNSAVLIMKGLPPLNDFIALAKKVFAGLKTDLKRSQFISELLSSVDADGKLIIKAMV